MTYTTLVANSYTSCIIASQNACLSKWCSISKLVNSCAPWVSPILWILISYLTSCYSTKLRYASSATLQQIARRRSTKPGWGHRKSKSLVFRRPAFEEKYSRIGGEDPFDLASDQQCCWTPRLQAVPPNDERLLTELSKIMQQDLLESFELPELVNCHETY